MKSIPELAVMERLSRRQGAIILYLATKYVGKPNHKVRNAEIIKEIRVSENSKKYSSQQFDRDLKTLLSKNLVVSNKEYRVSENNENKVNKSFVSLNLDYWGNLIDLFLNLGIFVEEINYDSELQKLSDDDLMVLHKEKNNEFNKFFTRFQLMDKDDSKGYSFSKYYTLFSSIYTVPIIDEIKRRGKDLVDKALDA